MRIMLISAFRQRIKFWVWTEGMIAKGFFHNLKKKEKKEEVDPFFLVPLSPFFLSDYRGD